MEGDHLYHFTIRDDMLPPNIDIVAEEKQHAECHVVKKLTELFRDGQRRTVKLVWEERPSFTAFGRAREFFLRAEIGYCRERNPIWMEMERNLTIPPMPPKRQSPISRLGRWLADSWKATGTPQKNLLRYEA